MKTIVLRLILLLAFNPNFVAADTWEESNPNVLVEQMNREICNVALRYATLIDCQYVIILEVNRQLSVACGMSQKVELLILKDNTLTEISALKAERSYEISKIRYLKGLQIIKILYEKVLSLDHHFASVRTFSEINKLSNPNQYPEFSKLKEILANKREKKNAFDLTAVLGTNTVASVIQTFTAMVSSNLTKEEKEKELANVECILDFTLRMQNDLNTIYFETAFLQSSNEKMREDIELLFRDYTKAIGYAESLEKCRTNDDWETLVDKMDAYIKRTKASSGSEQYKMQVNLEFPIDRLLQFIAQYNSFIDQGGKFYEKFKIILGSYENEKQCETKLPPEYVKLKSDIDVAISKFNVAYKPVEINGSKMKEILYGLNEFE